MATSASKPILVKQLKEYLQEKQEPFKLSTYLLERTYSRKQSSSSNEGNRYCLTTSTENLKEPCSHELNKKRTLHTPRTLKWMLHKLITPNDKQELSTCNKAVKDKLISETMDMIQQIAETNWFSTVSNVTALSTSSDCGAPEANPSCEPQNGSLCIETSQH
ncbi:hypothetical protein Pint_33633 [Pistacia integerrima]|uniref:Uncharacterized protein n=1 Tax=Pistacia integerrima TaxID=434235 RepID=A0ACC0X8U8_9ROSI|nr:hypothetical protein Pint_33633 [Pistacia integerrima]